MLNTILGEKYKANKTILTIYFNKFHYIINHYSHRLPVFKHEIYYYR